jgi:hypothetical protein
MAPKESRISLHAALPALPECFMRVKGKRWPRAVKVRIPLAAEAVAPDPATMNAKGFVAVLAPAVLGFAAGLVVERHSAHPASPPANPPPAQTASRLPETNWTVVNPPYPSVGGYYIVPQTAPFTNTFFFLRRS